MDSFLKKIAKYQYPTLEELSKVQDDRKAPDLHRFGFVDQWDNDQIQKNLINGNTQQYNKLSHLYEWDQVLADKIVDLQTAYVYVLVHFRRGVPATADDYISNVSIRANHYNLKFYFTYLNYIIVSIVDNILQIINIYFNLGLNEKQVCKSKIIQILKEKGFDNVTRVIESFYYDFAKYSNFRNALAHRFSPVFIDRRTVLDENLPDRKITLGGNNEFPNFETEILSVEESFSHLRSYMEKLKNIWFSDSNLISP